MSWGDGKAGVLERCMQWSQGWSVMINRAVQSNQAVFRKNTVGTFPIPGLTSLRLHLVNPRLVNIHWISFDIEWFIIDYFLHNRCQDLPQGILTTGTAVETHHHFNNSRIPSHNFLYLVYFWSEEERINMKHEVHIILSGVDTFLSLKQTVKEHHCHKADDGFVLKISIQQ